MKIQLNFEINPAPNIRVDPHSTSVAEGEQSYVVRAEVVDANGNNVVGARATWRNAYDTVATVLLLADSTGVEGARMRIRGIHRGVTLAIASYGELADTLRVTVRAPGDTATTPNPPPPPVRPTTFTATIYVRGFVASSDTGTTGTLWLPGSTVTLTRLPLVAGDTLPPGVVPVTTPTLFGTLTVDANSKAVFIDVPQSRFRVQVAPPPGSTWLAGDFTVPPPQVANYSRIFTLYKP